jgi:pyrroloquinoline quinone biosynthesis protein D
MVKLNQSAGEILKRCDGTHTLAEIISELEAVFGATGLEPEIEAFVSHAYERGWLL